MIVLTPEGGNHLRYHGRMSPRIVLDEGPLRSAPVAAAARVRSRPERFRGRMPVAEIDWHRPRPDALLLLVTEEPAIGLRFHYAGVDWEVDTYRDGWIARMLTESAPG